MEISLSVVTKSATGEEIETQLGIHSMANPQHLKGIGVKPKWLGFQGFRLE